MYRFVLIAFILIAASPAQATIDSRSRSTAERPALDVAGSFADQVKAIEADLADGETYSEISQEDRAAVQAALRRIADELASEGSIEALSASEKAAVFNDQELANNILTKAGADSLLVCRREKKVGSHRTTTQCATVAERRRAADQTHDVLRDNALRFQCGDSGCLQRAIPGG
jgi:hypothetical protein